jgi:hypothetical protein
MPRELDAILTAAVKLIDPAADSIGLFRATLETTISTVREIHERSVNLPSPAEMKGDVADYLEALRAARKKAYAVAPFYWSADFVAALDQETREVKARAGFPVPHGAQPRDLTADMAARAARDLLETRFVFPEHCGKIIVPGVKNPWRRDATLTEGGPWLTLAALIYEAVTGRDNHDMMPACRQADELLLRLPYSSTPRPRRPKSRRATDARR